MTKATQAEKGFFKDTACPFSDSSPRSEISKHRKYKTYYNLKVPQSLPVQTILKFILCKNPKSLLKIQNLSTVGSYKIKNKLNTFLLEEGRTRS